MNGIRPEPACWKSTLGQSNATMLRLDVSICIDLLYYLPKLCHYSDVAVGKLIDHLMTDRLQLVFNSAALAVT
jgi:hypothetical protein